MLTEFFDFKAFPASVKNGFIFLAAGWAWHFFSLYRYFYQGEIPGRQVIICIAILFLTARGLSWARVLCILCNILIVLIYIFLATSFLLHSRMQLGLIALVNIVLFSLSTYFFILRESSIFFRAGNRNRAGTGNDRHKDAGQR